MSQSKFDTWSTHSQSSDDDEVKEYQRWAHITLSDFRSNNCWTGFSYGYLWFLSLVAVAVYAADTYTAVILLAYNRWPGQIAPAIPFNVSRWLFAACILFSWVLCAYQWYRALKVLRRGSVAKDYLDPLAATLQSMRSWRKFLVFAELTKSKKGADYVALFAYFQFKGAIRTVFAEGPRQAINAITLYSVMKGDLVTSNTDLKASLSHFGTNVRVLAETQSEHAIVLFTMLFTLIIWLFSALSLIAAFLSWLGFLVHYIEGGNLTRYCKRKIEKRLRRIVEYTFQKELVRQEAKKRRAEDRAQRRAGGGGLFSKLARKPSLLSEKDDADADALSLSTTATGEPTRSSFESWSPRVPRPPPMPTRKPTSATLRLARRPTLPTIEASPSSAQGAFRAGSPDAPTAPLLAADPLQPAPLNIRRKPVSVGGRFPVNPHPPPAGPVPRRPSMPGARRPSAAGVPVPAPTPHTRGAGGIGGPTTFAAMGL